MIKTIGLISDTHNMHSKIHIHKDIDLLLHAGDLTGRGNEQELGSFNEWCGTLHLPKERIIVIAGNHDHNLSISKPYAKSLLYNCTYLEDELYEIDGLKIYGTPWTPTYGMWAFMVDPYSDRMRRYREAIPEGIHILLCHGPRRGVLSTTDFGDEAGCSFLAKRLEDMKEPPKVVVCGHIHEGHGVMSMENVLYINASSVDQYYQMRPDPVRWLLWDGKSFNL